MHGEHLNDNQFFSWCSSTYHKTHYGFSFIDAILTLAGYATVTYKETINKTLETNLRNGKNNLYTT
jgi:hypothetical protein